jgi:hypothetical protein
MSKERKRAPEDRVDGAPKPGRPLSLICVTRKFLIPFPRFAILRAKHKINDEHIPTSRIAGGMHPRA